jgi:cell division protein FtsX
MAVVLRRPRAAAWTMLALSCALFAVGVALAAAAAIDRWAAAHPATGGNLVVYLAEGVDDDRASALVRELGSLRGVERAELVPATESAHRLRRALGPDPSLLDGIDPATLPASVEVRLAPGIRDVVAMSPTVRALRGAPGVADVIVDDGGDDPMPSALATARAVAWPAAIALIGLALATVLATVRVRLERSPREAAVLELLGAPPAFAAIPSALAGALQGAIAALAAALALIIVLGGHPGAIEAVERVASLGAALGGLVALGALAGLVGGTLAGVARAR